MFIVTISFVCNIYIICYANCLQIITFVENIFDINYYDK